jgi:ABC-type Mn2+/Zn2+ transport system permease subunit
MCVGVVLGIILFAVSGYIGGAATRKLKELFPIASRGGIRSGFFFGISVYDAAVPRSLQRQFFVSRILSFISCSIGLIASVYFGWKDWVWIFLLSCVVGVYVAIKDSWLYFRQIKRDFSH